MATTSVVVNADLYIGVGQQGSGRGIGRERGSERGRKRGRGRGRGRGRVRASSSGRGRRTGEASSILHFTWRSADSGVCPRINTSIWYAIK